MSHRHAVGYGKHYDRLGALQFGVLIDQGLTEGDMVLDVGCGPLRLGRILIPWLKKGRYHGIDPEELVVESALDKEIGREMVTRKDPEFLYRGDFPFDRFGTVFDFIVIHSVFIHMPMRQVQECLLRAAKAMKPNYESKLLFTFKQGPTTDISEWVYPEHVTHSMKDLSTAIRKAGMRATALGGPGYRTHDFTHDWMLAQKG
jgi:SAM-dependent methyltransferase